MVGTSSEDAAKNLHTLTQSEQDGKRGRSLSQNGDKIKQHGLASQIEREGVNLKTSEKQICEKGKTELHRPAKEVHSAARQTTQAVPKKKSANPIRSDWRSIFYLFKS